MQLEHRVINRPLNIKQLGSFLVVMEMSERLKMYNAHSCASDTAPVYDHGGT